MSEVGGRWVGSNKLVELKKEKGVRLPESSWKTAKSYSLRCVGSSPEVAARQRLNFPRVSGDTTPGKGYSYLLPPPAGLDVTAEAQASSRIQATSDVPPGWKHSSNGISQQN